MDSLIVVLVLLILALVGGSLLGWVAFGRTNELRRRLDDAETAIRTLQAALAARAGDGASEAAPVLAAAPAPTTGGPAVEAPAVEEPAAEAVPDAPAETAGAIDTGGATGTPPPPPRRRSLEESIGTRWAVWVGGLALALGGVFLVRYSIEAGLIGPAARIILGLAFAALLLAAGEWLRRREDAEPATDARAAYVPGVLTAAGTVSAFAAIYAAYALYGFLGDAAAFVALGAVAVATLFLALLHGPGLAGLGLAAGYGSPLLVSSDAPAYGPLVLYLLVLTVATLAVARLRSWRWLAVTAVVGQGAWALLMTAGSVNPGFDGPVVGLHIALSVLLAVGTFAASIHPRDPGRPAPHDRVGALMPATYALPVLAHVAGFGDTATGAMLVFGLGAVLAVTAYEWPAVRLTALGTILTVVIGLGGLAVPDLRPALESGLVDGLPAVDTGRLIGAAVLAGLLFGALGLVGVAGSAARVPLAAVGALVPLGAGIVAYLRIAEFTTSLPFGAAALALAAYFAAATDAIARRLDARGFGVDGAVATYAVATVAALACGFTALLEKGFLTIALALMVPAIAWVEAARPVAGLRSVAVAVAVLVAGRFAVDPEVVGEAVGTTPVFNWLLYGYGVPALAFAAAAWRFGRTRQDAFVPLIEAFAVTFTTLTLVMVIHHAMTGGDITAPVSGLAEQSLLTMSLLAVSLGMQWLGVRRPGPVFAVGPLVVGAIGLMLAGFGLLIAQNPLTTGEPVDGGALSGLLVLGYALPALLAVAVAALARRRADQPRWYASIAGWLAGALLFMWVTLAVRAAFHTGDLAAGPVEEGELYAYSAVWLLFGLVTLGVGLVTRARAIRAVAAALIAGVVVKVFLVDTAGLGGALRAASFMGTGAVLILIGFGYQRLVRRFGAPA